MLSNPVNETENLAFSKDRLREKIRNDIKFFLNSGGKISEVDWKPKPRPLHFHGAYEDHYCGMAKTAIIINWLNKKPSHGRRQKLSALTGISMHRFYNIRTKNVRITNAEYRKIRQAINQIERKGLSK